MAIRLNPFFKTTIAISLGLGLVLVIASGCVKQSAVAKPVGKSSQTPSLHWSQHKEFLNRRDQVKQLTSLLVQEDDSLIVEHYQGIDKDDPQDVRSVTKSILALLVGTAIDQRHFDSCDQQVDRFFDQSIEFDEGIVGPLTLEHLLSMTDGFNYDESTEIGPLLRSRSPSSFLLKRMVVRKPGSEFKYSSATSNLLSLALSRATKTPTEKFAQTELFGPLGIERYTWDKGPDGQVTGGYGLNIKPSDLLVIGDLINHDGKFGEKQIVDQGWLERIAKPRSFRVQRWGAISNLSYGMLWWTGRIEGEEVVFALGHGGQYLMLVPSLNLTIVTTASYSVDRDEADLAEREISELLAFVVKQTKTNRGGPAR